MSSIVEIINHYQTSINKSLNDTARIVHCIGKLYKLPISVRHLQDTGIGRTVNSLRKYDGEVGVAAKALVTKWKAMVAAEESDENTGTAGSHGGGEGADSDGRQTEDQRQHRSDMSDQEEENGPGDGHERTVAEDDDEEDDDEDDEDDDDDDDDDDCDEDGRASHNGDHQNESYQEPPLRVDEEYREEAEGNNSDSNGDYSDDQTAAPSEVHHVFHHHAVEPNDQMRLGDTAPSSHWNEHHTSSSSSSGKRYSSGSSRNQHHSSTSKSSRSTGSGEKHKNHSSSGSSNSKRKSESDHHHRHSSSGGESKSHKSSSSRTDHHHGHATDEADADGDSAALSKRSRKEHRSDRGDTESTAQMTPSPSQASTSSSLHSKKDKSKEHSSSSSSAKRREHRDKSESSRERSDESRSKSKRKEKASSSSPANSQQEHTNDDSAGEDGNGDGLDCSGGASFADALAMIGMPSGTKKKPAGSSKEKVKVTVTKTSSSSSSSTRDGQASHSRSKQEPSRPSASSSTSVGRASGVPTASELLSQNVKLEPLPEASEIVDALPMISPHYRPMPLNQTVMDCVFMGGQGGRGKGRPLTEEEALGQSMQSKNRRTKIYSGMKTNAKGVIPTLYELCIRLLQDHIDEIGATGGIPFYILKPVLERANPTQLLHLEHFNPHFVEDSDVLWEQHCKRTFRSKQRNEEELETWREMFLRCSEERDAKLRSLTQNIKLSQEQAAAPIRKTQLAYVDSAVKPPRSVISKQVKYGTARAPVVSPAARVAALKAGNVTQAGDARLRVAAGVRDNAQAQVFQPTKPRKAPMMAKVLSSMKGFKTSFRR
uniref:TFIIS N-terminal domain-containing protein n=1 Tax=Anopheles epiroticus TaxID=199890 RepID=A0A182PG79_9DIPT